MTEFQTKAAEPGADDLDVLHPERTKTIAGRKITMREYGFKEGLMIRSKARMFLQGLYEQMRISPIPTIAQIKQLIEDHADLVLELIADAAGLELEFFSQLSDQDGQSLIALWWVCNGPFYVRTAIQRIEDERIDAAIRSMKGKLPDGQMSTQS